MKLVILGSTSYKIITKNHTFWEHDYNKAKKIYDNLKKETPIVKLIIEQWEGEIGGEGVHSEDIIYE